MKKDTRFMILFFSQGVLGILLGVLVFQNFESGKTSDQGGVDVFKDVASKLHAAGLVNQAARQYEKYLEKGKVDAKVKAKMSYSLGELYEEEGHLEEAISWFYKVELLDPQSTYVTEANKRIVTLLEKLKKFGAARAFIKDKTTLSTDKGAVKRKGAAIVAKVGDQNIYDYQLNEYVDSFDRKGQENLKSHKVKQELLQQYVINQILWQKSKRLGLEKDPSFIKKLENVTKQLLVERLLKNEVEKKIKVDEVDLKNYFKANRSKFSQKSVITLTKIEFKGKDHSQKIKAYLKGRKKETKDLITEIKKRVPSALFEKGITLTKGLPSPGLDLNPSQMNNLFKKEKGEWSGPFLKSGAYKMYIVTGKTRPQEYAYDDIKKVVKQSYKVEKGQGLYKKLVQESFKNENVQLFVERWK
ncbi:MAG: hypothetical protein CME68_00625 [Halobacteriovoraceae bacterium]|nr:hypothetical protein [Halobacteriovoraceae bacterium]